MSAPGLPEAFWSGKALFCHVQWLRETVFPVPFVLHVSPTLTHVAFRLQWVKWPLQTFLLPPANHPGLSLADFDLGLKTGKIPPSIRASQTIAELSRRDSEELQIHEMFETLSLTYVSFYTLAPISYFTVLEIQKLHHSFCHCSFA